MTAIAGLWRLRGGEVERAELDAMSQALARRGAERRIWIDGPVGLVERGAGGGEEAKVEGSRPFVVAADADVHNRSELLRELPVDRPAAEVDEHDLIGLAYERWRERCAARLLGDFAFVVWDARKQSLLCARDPLGVRPFYYHLSDSLFAFATDFAALLALAEVPRRLNEEQVARLLSLAQDDKVGTFYRDIVRLPPAHTLVIDRHGAGASRYWRIDPAYELRLGSEAEYVARFRETFSAAVAARMPRSDGVASMLSGGLDSTSITCVARELRSANGGGPLPTFSAVFDEFPAADERRWIEPVLALDAIEGHVHSADSISPLGDVDAVLDVQAQPFFEMGLCLHDAVIGAAAAHGTEVLLSGIEGDSVVSHGLERLIELARAGHWLRVVREARALSRHPAGGGPRSPWWLIRTYVVAPAIPHRVRRARRRLLGRPELPSARFLQPEFARRYPLAEWLGTLERWPAAERSARATHWGILDSGVFPTFLERLDRTAAARGVRLAFPFFDRRLVELCVSLPSEQKLRDGWTRSVLRRAMAGTVPDEVRWRLGKATWTPVFLHGLLRQRRLVQETLAEAPRLVGDYLDAGRLWTAYDHYAPRGVEGLRAAGWPWHAHVTTAVMLTRWLDRQRGLIHS